MAKRNRRLVVLLGLIIVVLGACTNGENEDDLSLPETSETVSSTTTTAPTTTSSTATTTTLSEYATAEAEIRQVITDWWTMAYAADQERLGGTQYLTGLVKIRIETFVEELADEGVVLRGGDGMRVDITAVEVDLEQGEAEATGCIGSDGARFDIETGEQIREGDDPSYQTMSRFVLERTLTGWKISEFFPSQATDNPVECEIGEV